MLDSAQIRELRLALGWSFAELAAYLKVSEAAVRRWENGDRHPRWDAAKALSGLWDKARLEGKLSAQVA